MNNLNKILKRKNIKEIDLAQHLGVTRQCVNRWTHNINYPNKKYIKAISDFLNVSIEELFFSGKDKKS